LIITFTCPLNLPLHKMNKQYRITDNGFICLFHNGIKTSTHFYTKGDELELERNGYERI